MLQETPIIITFFPMFQGIGLVGHQHPVDQAHGDQFNVAFLSHSLHQFFESGVAQLLFVEARSLARYPLLQGCEQGHAAGLTLGPDDVLDDADDVGKLLPPGGRGSSIAALADGDWSRFRRGSRIHVHIVQDQSVHLVCQAAGGAPGNSDYYYLLPHSAEGVDDVDEVRIA